MLVVKALDMTQRQVIARSPEDGAPGLTLGAIIFAILGAVFLVLMANQQVFDFPGSPSNFDYGSPPMSEF